MGRPRGWHPRVRGGLRLPADLRPHGECELVQSGACYFVVHHFVSDGDRCVQVGCGVGGWYTRVSGDARCVAQNCTTDLILDYGRFLEGFAVTAADLPAVSSDEPLVIPPGSCMDTYNPGRGPETATVVECRPHNTSVRLGWVT